jgi:hypothetical protein
MDLRISKEKQISLFFQCLLESLCHFKKQIEHLRLSNFIHMFTCNFIQIKICVISFKYVEIISKH